MDKIKDFFLNQLTGRLIVRASISIVSYLASGAIGAKITMDPNEVALALNAGLHGLLSLLKPRTPAPAPESIPA